MEVCGELGVKFLTVFVFSTENWQRPQKEVENLMNLLVRGVDEQRADLQKNRVRVRAIGRLYQLPKLARTKILSLIDDTSGNTGLTLTLALSYGGRPELLDALHRAWQLWHEGELKSPPASEAQFARLLYDPELPDVDLLIRTGGERRISNFLLWHIAYAELYFTETLWPDFRRPQLMAAIEDYSKRQRRFGRVEEK